MKLLIEKQKFTVFFLLTILILSGTSHTGYGQAGDPPLADANSAPMFSEDESTTRTVAENTASGENIGTAFTATDADNDTLTYALSGTDAPSFSIGTTTGQLQTSTALDFETKSSYSVTVSVSDGNGGSNAIDVTINVTDVNELPVLSEGASATRTIAENTAPGTNIGPAFTATDPDSGDTLTYSLRRGDREAFQIDPNTGQVQTRAALDYETKNAYTDLAVRVTDGSGLRDVILVTITVTDVDEDRAPAFTDGETTTRSVAENTASGQDIDSAISATDPDDDTLTYTLGGTDAASFSIVSTTGQLQTRAALDYETESSYSVTVSVSDGKGGSDAIDVRINVTNVNEAPVLSEGADAMRSVAETTAAGTNIGAAFIATDPDSGDTLTYSLHRGDRDAFQIDPNTGQVQTKAPLDYETKNTYDSLAVRVTDSGGLTDVILVTITVTDVNEAPVFTEGASTRRIIAENTAANTNIGSVVAATDADKDTLTYTLSGTDAASFSIVSTTGQLQTNAALDDEIQTSYSVTLTVSDGSLTDSIDITITVTDVNEAPVFTEGVSTRRAIAENTASGENIGSVVAATDADTGDTLTYTLSGTDAASFSIVSTTGQLQTRAALDYETESAYSVTVSVSDGNGGSDAIDVRINVTNVNETPMFSQGTHATLAVAENTAAGTNIGAAFIATDPDSGDTLTYSLRRGDKDAFQIDPNTGQVQTRAALDYETKNAYDNLAVRVTDSGGLIDAIIVTITVTDVDENRAPAFTDRDTTTRSVAENTASGEDIGSAISATDPDDDTLTYTLGGTDAASFSIVSTSGQLRTRAALDYETKTFYTVGVTRTRFRLTQIQGRCKPEPPLTMKRRTLTTISPSALPIAVVS